jgi:hypothetical protein
MRIQKHSRPLVILLAIVVVIITSMVVANATQTITTPNAVSISYNLAVGTGSAVITPATNKSVLVMGCCTSGSNSGVGQVTLLHPAIGGLLWVGLESFPGAVITQGGAGTNGVHIVYLDRGHTVDIETASSSTIVIENMSSGIATGNVTLVW